MHVKLTPAASSCSGISRTAVVLCAVHYIGLWSVCSPTDHTIMNKKELIHDLDNNSSMHLTRSVIFGIFPIQINHS